jgi:hypothetical protein|tara:strand:- start:433 stop:660 length:228 start_codon:yes stop_codon:yes gene_type:complete
MIYCILDIRELNNVNYSEVRQDCSRTVRENLAGTEFIISFPADAVPAIADSETKYTHSEILAYLTDPSNGWDTKD